LVQSLETIAVISLAARAGGPQGV